MTNGQQAPAQRPVQYFIVMPTEFNAVVNKLSELPYNEVAGLLQQFVGSSRAMFDPPPAIPGQGGQIADVPELDPTDPDNELQDPTQPNRRAAAYDGQDGPDVAPDGEEGA